MSKISYILVSLLIVLSSLTVQGITLKEVQQKIIEEVNTKENSTWKAGSHSIFNDFDIKKIKDLYGALQDDLYNTPYNYFTEKEIEAANLPKNFFPEQKWPNCETLTDIRDQSTCSSCWAFSTTTAMSDRICIHSENQNLNVRLSPEDILSCCGLECGLGCMGGYPTQALKYYVKHGIVSGYLYNNTNYCRSYTFPPCDHYERDFGKWAKCGTLAKQRTPQCIRECHSESGKTYEEDLHFGEKVYRVPDDEKQIMMELMTNGPIVTSIDGYEDLLTYKSGVYQHYTGKLHGNHAMKVVGWGEENGTPYWLVANTWNRAWGEAGFIKWLRGSNHCGIEATLVTALPKKK